MTISDFKFLLSDTLSESYIGGAGTQVIALFNTSSLGTTIDAIALQVDNTTTLTTLEQAITVTLKLPASGSVISIAVTDSLLPYRLINKSVVQQYFVYEIYPENQRPVIINPTTGSATGYEEYITELILEPTSTQESFSTSAYNILIGDVQQSRQSIYAYKLDKIALVGTGSNPRNLPSILTDTAQPADIQDSSYLSRTWINPRYEGSTLTTITNGNTDPFISATPVQGAFYEKGVLDSFIVSEQQANTVKYEEFFYNGIGTVPDYALIDTNWTFVSSDNSGFNQNTTQVVLTIGSDILKNPIGITDILRVSGSISGISTEILSVTPPTTNTNYYPFENIGTTTGTLNIVRGYSGTPRTGSFNDNSRIYKVNPTYLYRRAGAGFLALREGKFITNRSATILNIGLKGQVISGSTTNYL